LPVGLVKNKDLEILHAEGRVLVQMLQQPATADHVKPHEQMPQIL
jgi:hypothetical protein